MQTELEKLYSPSQWSKRCSPKQVMDEFYDFITSKTKEVETDNEFSIERNIRYGQNEKMLIDIYSKTSLRKDSPLLVFIHGGFWQEGSKDCYGFFKAFCQKGIRVMVAGYDLAPQVSLKEIMDEMRELSRFLQNYSSDNQVRSLWLCGHSAGAHLAVTTTKWLLADNAQPVISGLMLISGLYYLEPVISTTNNINLNLSKDQAETFSPIKWFLDSSANRIKEITFVIAVGENESPAFIQQSSDYAKHVEEEGGKMKYFLVAECDHFNIITNLYYPHFSLTTTLLQYML